VRLKVAAMLASVLFPAAVLVSQALGAPAPDLSPIVSLSYGSFQGVTVGAVTTFLGMPFAAPPVRQLRFAPPQPPVKFQGVRQAVAFGSACPQQLSVLPAIPGLNLSVGASAPLVTSEDCLFVNVVKPAVTPPGTKLPVLFWIFGGGFEDGDTSTNPGNPVVERSIALGEPVIYVSTNYRTNAFGFLGGAEVKAAGIGNAGLRDQRFAMEWVHQFIEEFGGDPDKVTIWGESAGAISVGLHMVVNNGNPDGLFRGAFMESGSPIPLKDITSNQPFYDALVADTGCSGAADTLQCLREVPFATLQTAVNESPSIFAFMSLELAWQPTIDGVFLQRNAQDSIVEGLYAKVPFVTGDCDDEGTLFSLSTLNITTDAEYIAYIGENYLTGANATTVAAVGQAYPDDITQGSPFNTSVANAITPEFKRLAAFQGDIVFQAPRRFFLRTASKTQDAWTFLFKRGKATPVLGAFHGSDIPEFYSSGVGPDFIGTDALVNFANHLNPTLPKNPISLLSAVNWQQWATSASAPPMLTFLDPAPLVAITPDNYREDAMNLLMEVSREILP